MEPIEQLIPRRQGYKMVGLSNTTGWRRERDDPEFPKPVVSGPNRFAFKLSDLQRYIASRPVAVPGPRPERALEAQRLARERQARIRELERALERERLAEGADA
jgi:predicted DNA-binding transcriptional regulator AlpA